MNSCAIDIKQMLEEHDSSNNDSSGEVTLFPIYIGIEPSQPLNCITIFDTMGAQEHQLTFDKNEVYEYYAIQLRIRSISYQDGWQVINHIKTILHGRAQETWNDAYYALIRCTSGPAQLDIDKNQRFRFIINFNVQRR